MWLATVPPDERDGGGTSQRGRWAWTGRGNQYKLGTSIAMCWWESASDQKAGRGVYTCPSWTDLASMGLLPS